MVFPRHLIPGNLWFRFIIMAFLSIGHDLLPSNRSEEAEKIKITKVIKSKKVVEKGGIFVWLRCNVM